jgi:hypothetical protein
LHAASDPIAAEGVHDVLNWHSAAVTCVQPLPKEGILLTPNADASCIRGGGAYIESEVVDAGAENINGIVTRVRCDSGLGMALISAMRVCAQVQIPVRKEPPLVFSHKLLGGLRTGFLVVSPFELHVYSSMWSEAEALSEYGVVPE